MKVLKLFFPKVKVPKTTDLKVKVKKSGCMKVKVLKVEDDVLLMWRRLFLVSRATKIPANRIVTITIGMNSSSGSSNGKP